MSDALTHTEIVWHEALSLDELWEDEMLDIEIGDEIILLVHAEGGEIRAYQGVCPHQEILLADGEFEENIITCTAHHWQFNALTGEGVNPKGCKLFQYPVRVENDTIYVGIPQDGKRHYNRCTAS